MLNRSFLSSRTRRSAKSGFTLVELLVVIAIIGLLASVAYPSILGAYKTAQQNVAMQNSKSIGQSMFQYSADPNNNGLYPGGATSTDVFNTLISSSYISNPTIFYISGAPGGKNIYRGVAGASPVLPATGNCWDVTASNGVITNAQNQTVQAGLSTGASDDTPLVFSTGAKGVAYTGGNAPTLDGQSAFLTTGIAVCYKGQNATFLKADATNKSVPNFVPLSYSDPAGTAKQLTP